jgi:endo-1,4-beta-xylanase
MADTSLSMLISVVRNEPRLDRQWRRMKMSMSGGGMIRRRKFIKGLGAAAALPLVGTSEIMAQAARFSIPYGAAVQDGALRDDPNYRDALKAHCQLLVGEGGLKWFDIRPTREQFVFDAPDKVIEFATQNGMKMRGHTLVWYSAMPDWALAIRGAKAGEYEMVHHIETVAGRYKGIIPSWDVVNEPIADVPSYFSSIRDSVWKAALGPGYIELALRTAARVDPDAQLVINEYDIEMNDRGQRSRRNALLDLVKDLKDKDVPLHAIGLQGHLRSGMEIDKDGVAAFVSELASMNVDVLVTEMDVIDNKLPTPEADRDRAVANLARDFLSAISDGGKPTAILTWGISDRYTWVPMYFKRDDGTRNRPLPLDADFQPKAFMDVIDSFRR